MHGTRKGKKNNVTGTHDWKTLQCFLGLTGLDDQFEVPNNAFPQGEVTIFDGGYRRHPNLDSHLQKYSRSLRICITGVQPHEGREDCTNQ
jgi:hypothetical protein